MSGPGEFDLVARIRARASTRDAAVRDAAIRDAAIRDAAIRDAAIREDVVLGIGDDAALLRVPAGKLLAVATDTLNVGVHFPEDTAPVDIGWKSLAVNLSDLAAMGAQPAWCTLSLSLPVADATWLEAFLDGFMELAGRHRVALVGGDTTRGPLSICVTAHGFVDPADYLRRDAAKTGDDIWVTGTLGDAAVALAQWKSGRGSIDAFLRQRLDHPTPRIEAGLALAGVAHACIDVSDGLLADLGHVCRESGVGAEVEIDALPASAALAASFEVKEDMRAAQATGGDDYELCFTAPADLRDVIAQLANSQDIGMTRIGRIVEGASVRALLDDGSEWGPRSGGYSHFA